MSLTPSQRLQRLKAVQDAAAELVKAERARVDAMERDLSALEHAVDQLQARLAASQAPLSQTEIDELNWLARDYKDENNGDWTR
jgi:hypothetical protein